MKVIALATHPIQYQVPVFKELNSDPSFEFTALFLSDHSVNGGFDPGFGRSVQWDVPILEGYNCEFLRNSGGGNSAKGFFAYRTPDLRETFERLNSDVLLLPGHMVFAYWQAVRAAKTVGIPVVARPDSLSGVHRRRSALKSLIRSQALKWFYGNVDVFCSSGYFSTQDAETFGFDVSNIVSAPYSVDSQLFEDQRTMFAPDRNRIRRDFGMQPDDVGLVFTGKFIDWKNPDLILDAIEILKPEIKAKVFPIFMGDGVNHGQILVRCRSILGEGRFCLPGFVNQSELGKHYAAGDFFVLPSKRGHESWGLVVNEAMTFGLPCVVSDGVGSRIDLVKEGETGYIFEDGDTQALAEHITQLVMDGELREKMGAAAYQHIQEYSTISAAMGVKQALSRALEIKKASSKEQR